MADTPQPYRFPIMQSSPFAINETDKPPRDPAENSPIPFAECQCGHSICVPIWFSENSLRVRVARENQRLATLQANSRFVLIRHSMPNANACFEIAHVINKAE